MSGPDRRPILTPCCPKCGQPPVMAFGGGSQAFCGTDSCAVFTWDTAESAETFEANAKPVRFIDNDKDGPEPE